MPPPNAPEVRFWPTVQVLLRFARKRTRGRVLRQRQLMGRRSWQGGATRDWGVFGWCLAAFVAVVLHSLFALTVSRVLDAAHREAAGRSGKMVVSTRFAEHLADYAEETSRHPERKAELKKKIAARSREEADRLSELDGISASEADRRLRGRYARDGVAGFVALPSHEPWRKMFQPPCELESAAGLVLVIWWLLMVTFQGEGFEFDTQRRRHPMWEWLLSHPVKPGAVFLAEMLSPLAANPNAITAPLFWIILLKLAGHPLALSILMGLILGVPLTLAASCLSKALEIGCMLRLAPRNRGAALGLMSWLGLATMMGALIVALNLGAAAVIERGFEPLAALGRAPIFSWLIGYQNGAINWWGGIAVAWGTGLFLIAASVWFSARATEQGLAGGFEATVAAPARRAGTSRRWIRDPLARKELLWLWRDRGAVVQAFLIPATLASYQLINLRGALRETQGHWSWFCSVAIIFGTYFLFVLGPRSLLSEGPALWLAQTWPCGLEGLMRAKARLWFWLSQLVVGIGFGWALALHLDEWWKVLLAWVGWLVFSRSLAEKAVTLISRPSDSGEAEPIPKGRRYAAWLGTFTFATGIATQRWAVAVTGVIYSWLTAAAIWQNFRERLPYLYDPWSERLPRPPTVMHAMVAILAMTEVAAISFGALAGIAPAQTGLWRALTYGISAFLTFAVTSGWLRRRSVSSREVWHWPVESRSGGEAFWRQVREGAWGLGGGLLLAGCAGLYLEWLRRVWPEVLASQASIHALMQRPDQRLWMLALGVLAAPLAEEYLFRGLLYRALDREWGGAKAVLGSAGFFAIYHPPVSWAPVVALGIFNAWLFKRTGSLWPPVFAHAAYNAVVMGLA